MKATMPQSLTVTRFVSYIDSLLTILIVVLFNFAKDNSEKRYLNIALGAGRKPCHDDK